MKQAGRAAHMEFPEKRDCPDSAGALVYLLKGCGSFV